MKKILSFLILFCGLFAQAQDASFITDDGWQLKGRWKKPLPGKPVLLLIHTQKSNMTEWKKWFPEIEKYGIGYLALDLRGHGISNISPDGSTTTFKSFSVSGLDNEYNKMIRDLDSAIVWISSQGVSISSIVPVGSWLGANLAIKTTAINKDLPMAIAIYPSMNINDVLIVNPLRAYGKRPLLIISSDKFEKKYKELQLLNDIAKFSCGKENVYTYIETAISGPADFKKTSINRVLQWTLNPKMPETIEYTHISSDTIKSGDLILSTETAKEQTESEDYD